MTSLPIASSIYGLNYNRMRKVIAAIQDLEKEVISLKQSKTGSKHIYFGSKSKITKLMKLKFLDKIQLCVHPAIAGKGVPYLKKSTTGHC